MSKTQRCYSELSDTQRGASNEKAAHAAKYDEAPNCISKGAIGGIPFSIIGMALIAAVWGFFEGFNYAVICKKINRRYPSKNQCLDYGAISCAIIFILFHPFSISFWGIVELLATFIAIYGMLVVRKKTENAWGCVFSFCFI